MHISRGSLNPCWIDASQAAFLRRRLHKRYHRHLDELRIDGLPACLYDRDSGMAVLIKAGPLGRAIIVLANDDAIRVDPRLFGLLSLAERHCQRLRRFELTFRCPHGSSSHEVSRELLQQWMPDHWSEAERMQTYYRRNLRGLDEPIGWLAREYPSDDDCGGLNIVPWQDLASRSDVTNKVQAAAPLSPELWPENDDFDPRYSFAFVREQQGYLDYELAGWLIISRRSRGLLYNRLFVVQDYRNFWNLGTRLVAAALLKQYRQQPETAVRLHVRHAQAKIAIRYATFLRPWCDQFEENWVSHSELSRDVA